MSGRLVLLVSAAVVLGGLFLVLKPREPETVPQVVEAPIEVRAGRMYPTSLSVFEGDQLMLRITADVPTELHLHGYDLTRTIDPSEIATLNFEARLAGRFEIEDERTGRGLGTLVVRPRVGG